MGFRPPVRSAILPDRGATLGQGTAPFWRDFSGPRGGGPLAIDNPTPSTDSSVPSSILM